MAGDSIRASDAERDVLGQRLTDACSAGRLTMDEFSERMERVYVARTRGELAAIAADLPTPTGTTTATTAREPVTHWHITPVGGLKRRGRWRLGDRTIVLGIVGGMNLDLGEAELPAAAVALTCISLVGGVHLRVPPGIRVAAGGFSLVGGRHVDLDDPGPGAPVVKVRNYGIVGGITARSSRPLDRWRKALSSIRS